MAAERCSSRWRLGKGLLQKLLVVRRFSWGNKRTAASSWKAAAWLPREDSEGSVLRQGFHTRSVVGRLPSLTGPASAAIAVPGVAVLGFGMALGRPVGLCLGV